MQRWRAAICCLSILIAATLIAACGYLALEPFARRLWPNTLISWTRLTRGRLRDPLIARDILIGGAVGALVLLIQRLEFLVPTWLGRPPGLAVVLVGDDPVVPRGGHEKASIFPGPALIAPVVAGRSSRAAEGFRGCHLWNCLGQRPTIAQNRHAASVWVQTWNGNRKYDRKRRE